MMVKNQGRWVSSRKCTECKGKGKVEQEEINDGAISVILVECPVCFGEGWFTSKGNLT